MLSGLGGHSGTGGEKFETSGTGSHSTSGSGRAQHLCPKSQGQRTLGARQRSAKKCASTSRPQAAATCTQTGGSGGGMTRSNPAAMAVLPAAASVVTTLTDLMLSQLGVKQYTMVAAAGPRSHGRTHFLRSSRGWEFDLDILHALGQCSGAHKFGVGLAGESASRSSRWEQVMDATSALPKMKQYLRKIKRQARYVPKIVNYGTPKKLANILLAEWEFRQQKTILRCLPYYFIVDVCNVCNLRCPLCPTGNTNDCSKASDAFARAVQRCVR